MASNSLSNKFRQWLKSDNESNKGFSTLSSSEHITPRDQNSFNFSAFRKLFNDSATTLASFKRNQDERFSQCVSTSHRFMGTASAPLPRRADRSQCQQKMRDYLSRRGQSVSSSPAFTTRYSGDRLSADCTRNTVTDIQAKSYNITEATGSNETKEMGQSNDVVSKLGTSVHALIRAPQVIRKTEAYDRQDSGFDSVGDDTIGTQYLECHDISEEGNDSEPILNPYQTIRDMLYYEHTALLSSRDPYRVTIRPSKITNRSIGTPKANINIGDTLFKGDIAGIAGKDSTGIAGKDNNDLPMLKIMIQTFESSQQIRVTVIELVNIGQLIQSNCKPEHELILLLSLGNRQFKIRRNIRTSGSNTLFEIIHFCGVDFDKLYSSKLRIQLYRTQSVWRKKKIGETSIPVGNFDFEFDTKLSCMLH